MRAAFPLLAFAVLVLVAYAPPDIETEALVVPGDTTWTWPDNPENLQVLPEDIRPFELSQVMRSFTKALGVRCQFCHVGTEEMSLGEFDFVSDDNEHKNTAREMMRMVWAINNDLLAGIDGLHEAEGMRVTCYTCHRGSVTPQTRPPLPRWEPPSDGDEGDGEDDDAGHDHDEGDGDGHEHEDGEDHDGGHDG